MKQHVLTPQESIGTPLVGTFQREISPRLSYGLWLTWIDRFHGLWDRPVVTRRLAGADAAYSHAPGVVVLDTLYLQRLARISSGHLEQEFVQTTAMLRQVDAELADAIQVKRQAQAEAEDLQTSEPDPIRIALDGEQVAQAELARRRTAAAVRVTAAEVLAARLELDRRAHWAALTRRAGVVLAFYDERAATYADVATRNVREHVAPVRVPRPGWLSRSQPPEPGQTIQVDAAPLDGAPRPLG